jgi:hypothetical protein
MTDAQVQLIVEAINEVHLVLLFLLVVVSGWLILFGFDNRRKP